MNLDWRALRDSVVTSPPYTAKDGFVPGEPLTGRRGGFFLLKQSRTIVRLEHRVAAPEGAVGNDYWWVEVVEEHGLSTSYCRDALLDRELTELEVIAWAAR